MTTLWQDARYAVRMMVKSPGFTAVAVITLALGIGANTAIFSVVNAVLLEPLPYPDPERLVFIWETSRNFGTMSISYPNYVDWREQVRLLEELAIFRRDSFSLTGGDEPERVRVGMVSANMFRAAGILPRLGRDLRDEEDRPGAERVVMLSHGMWERRFGADPAILGQALTLDGDPYTVVGVMPEGHSLPSRTDLWVPIGLFSDTESWKSRGNHPGIFGIGRLAKGANLEQARAEIDAIALRLEQEYPDTNTGNRVAYTPLGPYIVSDIRPALVVLQWAVAFVLLIACANTANLLLARAAARRREIAIRAAIGATRMRIIRQLLTESVLTALLGGGLGLLLAQWGTDFIVSIYPTSIPRAEQIALDGRVLLFTLGISVATGLVFGLLPARRAAGADLNEALKEGGRSGSGGRRQRMNRALVVSQVALALILLIGAGLLTRSFARLLQVDPGFEPRGLLTMNLSLPDAAYPDEPAMVRFYARLVPAIEALPGVEGAGWTSNLPLLGGSQTSFAISGRPMPAPGEGPHAEYAEVTPGYFRSMGLSLERGRLFTEDDRREAPRVVIIDESFALHHWPGEDPIGRRLVKGEEDVEENRISVVGVVSDVKYDGLDIEPVRPQMYFPYGQSATRSGSLVVRAAVDPGQLAASVRRAVRDLDGSLPVYDVASMERILADSLAPRRMNMMLLTFFSILAVGLALVGVYGVISYGISQRTHEFGVRLALGAAPRSLFWMVVAQGMAMAGAGLAIGLAGALVLTRSLSSLLFGVSATDIVTFAGVSLLMGASALIACGVPARRAVKVDPLTALRYE